MLHIPSTLYHRSKKEQFDSRSIIDGKSTGFTLIELLLTIGIAGVLISIITISLLSTQRTTSLSAAVETLEADMRYQQIKAMNGSSSDGIRGHNYGIEFLHTNQYVLFQDTYSAGSPNNTTVSLDSTITVSSTTNPLIFSQESGESGDNTITVSGISGDTKTLEVNSYGVVKKIL